MSSSDHPPPYPGGGQPGTSGTGPGVARPPLFIHECVPNCPALVPKPGDPGFVPPAPGPIHVSPPPGYTPVPGQPQFPGHQPAMPVIGPSGEPLFYHPHYPTLKADICKSCRNVVPIRPLKLARLTTEQVCAIQSKFLAFIIKMFIGGERINNATLNQHFGRPQHFINHAVLPNHLKYIFYFLKVHRWRERAKLFCSQTIMAHYG